MTGSQRPVALVMGGSRGIGAAIVRRLAADGAAVAFTYSRSEGQAQQLAEEVGGLAIKADSADPAEIQQAVAKAAELGPITALVNNAGVLERGDVVDFDLGTFDRMVAVNVRAPFVAIQAAVPRMERGGRIVNIGSIVAARSAFPGASVYSMTKAAVAAMTRGLAIDLGPRGITVNNVQPGPTDTDMNPMEARPMLMPLLPVGRLGTPEEVAGMVAYLLKPEAGFVTGASLTIDGGYTA